MTLAKRFHGDDLGARPISVAEVKAAMAQLDADMQRLDDTIRFGAVSRDFKRAWHDFVHGWHDYRDEWGSHLTASDWERIAGFRKDMSGWKRDFVALLKHGGRVGAGPRRDDDEVGALIVTPGAIKAEMDTVDAGIKQLDSDIVASPVREPFKKSWRGFADEWKKFYADHASWKDRLWGASYEKTVEYRNRIEQWRQALEREGGHATAPSLFVPDPTHKSIKPYLWAAGGLLAVGAVAHRALR